jgi:2-keto-4-pentenoate hydratase
MATVGEQALGTAHRFVRARRAADGLADFPGVLPVSLDDAYAIQDAAIGEWSKPVRGWKVGRIASPLAEKFGSDRLAGPIFDVVADGGDCPAMPVFERGFAAAEAEFLLRIGAAPPMGKTSFTLAEAAELIDSVHVGVEIASSPLKPINDLGPAAIVSDFGNNNGLLVGAEIPEWRDSGFEQWEVITCIDGEEIGRGSASSFANGALGSAKFLFELMARRGFALGPGQWISSGAVTGVHDVRPGQRVDVRFDRWYEVACRAVAAEPE